MSTTERHHVNTLSTHAYGCIYLHLTCTPEVADLCQARVVANPVQKKYPHEEHTVWVRAGTAGILHPDPVVIQSMHFVAEHSHQGLKTCWSADDTFCSTMFIYVVGLAGIIPEQVSLGQILLQMFVRVCGTQHEWVPFPGGHVFKQGHPISCGNDGLVSAVAVHERICKHLAMETS